ncbi:DUF6875 domain-containing protein [Streptomyces sp. R44]|uniref:DUF6875 domain-containing protein n=1 Tax=Streptomyces sp. R44 TaxID=3238633 RepID=A0AB39SYP1_9ACTN
MSTTTAPATATRRVPAERRRLHIRTEPAGHVFAADLAVVDAWLRDYVGGSHEQLGRTGPVCPFVPPALNDQAVQFHFRYDVDGSTTTGITEALTEELVDFALTMEPQPKSGASLECRLVVMPHTGPDGWQRLDDAYESLKNLAVEAGLMIGQFHPNCDERAVRNTGFRVSVAPIGLLAMRRMAPHDVLFLTGRRDWFEKYDTTFRSHYERGRVRDPLLRELYQAAVDRYELPALTLDEGATR